MASSKTFPTQPSLVGKTTYLRPATPEDFANTEHWTVQSEPQSLSCRPRLMLSASEISERAKKAERSIDEQQFMVMLQKGKTPVGRVSFFDYNPLNRSAELGLIIDPDERRRGYGKDALQTLTRFLFRFRGLNKVYFQTAAFNVGMIGLAEQLKFKKDGTLRDHYFYDGEFHDGLIYSLLLFELDF